MPQHDGSWHLDKKFALSIIAAIFLNCGSFIWYGSKMDSRVEADHQEIVEIKMWKEKQDDDKNTSAAHNAMVDEKLTNLAKGVDHITDLLEKQSTKK